MADNTVFSGKSNSILVGEETSYASGGTANRDLGFITSARVESSEDFEVVDPIGTRNTQYNVRTRYRLKGTIDAVYQHARILYYALGSVTHAGASDPYTHTMTEADVIPSLITNATKNFTSAGIKKIIVGLKIDKLKIMAEKSAVLKWSADWVAKVDSISTSTASQTLDDIVPPTPAQIAVYTGATGANPTDELPGVQSYELTIENNLIGHDSVSDVTITDLVEDRRKYSGKVTFAASNSAEVVKQLQLMLGSATLTSVQDTQDRRAIKLYWTNGLTPADTLTITLYGCTFKNMSDPYEKSGIMYIDAPFTAESLGSCVSQDDIASGSW